MQKTPGLFNCLTGLLKVFLQTQMNAHIRFYRYVYILWLCIMYYTVIWIESDRTAFIQQREKNLALKTKWLVGIGILLEPAVSLVCWVIIKYERSTRHLKSVGHAIHLKHPYQSIQTLYTTGRAGLQFWECVSFQC